MRVTSRMTVWTSVISLPTEIEILAKQRKLNSSKHWKLTKATKRVEHCLLNKNNCTSETRRTETFWWALFLARSRLARWPGGDRKRYQQTQRTCFICCCCCFFCSSNKTSSLEHNQHFVPTCSCLENYTPKVLCSFTWYRHQLRETKYPTL